MPKHGARTICLDRDWAQIASEADTNPQRGVTAEDLAYVIYTSGSTGQPKGVLINHANVVRLFTETETWYGFNERDVWTLFHSYAFDFSVWEIWGALLYGGRLVVVPYLVSREPEAFYQLLVREGVTVLNQTPSAFRQLIHVDERKSHEQELALRYVIMGGEALDVQMLQPWFDRHGDHTPQVVNMYGITETTVHVTYRPIAASDLQTASGSVIGRPIPDLQVYVLDALGQPVPIGVAGEMHVGGRGLARGYLNRVELTAERFIANPFAQQARERFYRTGDLARYLPNGDLEYLGRIDHQVKIRGFRIELGEIEAALGEHHAVREVVVLARDVVEGEKRLVAYVIADDSHVPSHGELRDFVKDKLPDYMVPAHVVLLDALPLTANGKVDREALPLPDQVRPELNDAFVPPRNETETALAVIFAKLLHLEQVGIYDNFFELGGHSLLATQLVSQLSVIFGVELALRTVFAHATVAALAEEVTRCREETGATGNVVQHQPIPRLPQQETYELSHAQERIWFLSQMNQEALAGGQFAIELQGALDADAFRAALRAVVVRHGIMRTTFGEQSGKPYQVVHDEWEIPCQYLNLSEQQGDAQQHALAEHVFAEKQQPFDLRTGPLFRMTLYKMAADRHLFVVNAHHIAYDGWSLDVFVRDLSTAYRQQKQGPGTTEQVPVLQYVDFAAWHNQRLASGALDVQRDYWLQQLDGVSTTVTMPYDTAEVVAEEPADAILLTVDRETTAKLQELARASESTLYMTVLAALNLWMSLLTGETDITVGSPISGRTHSELEGLMGVLINPVALRTDLTGNPSGLQVLERVKDTAFGAYTHQDYPFDLVVQALRSNRAFNTSLYTVVLVGQNAISSSLELDGVSYRSYPLHELLRDRETPTNTMAEDPTVEFDLVVDMYEAGEELLLNATPNNKHFSHTSFAHLMSQWESVLQQFAHQPHLRRSQLELPSNDDDLDDLF